LSVTSRPVRVGIGNAASEEPDWALLSPQATCEIMSNPAAIAPNTVENLLDIHYLLESAP